MFHVIHLSFLCGERIKSHTCGMSEYEIYFSSQPPYCKIETQLLYSVDYRRAGEVHVEPLNYFTSPPVSFRTLNEGVWNILTNFEAQ